MILVFGTVCIMTLLIVEIDVDEKKILKWIAKMFAIVTVAEGQLYFGASCIYTYSVGILFR